MRVLTCLALLSMLAVPGVAAQDHADRAVADGGTLPQGWDARTDRGTDLNNVGFTADGSTLHIVLGPRTIFYRSADTVDGTYTVTATFAEASASGHAEAFGIIIGGNDLQDDNQAYSYFLIRGNGQYLIKKRHGSTTSLVSGSWTGHDAINALGDSDRTNNTLVVEVGTNEVRFLVNGAEVFSAPASDLDTDGIVGLRANHNIDLVVEEFALDRG
ncbi:MAG: hypothetical protein V3T16_05650 [Gemmatimonadales bacterium]